MSEMGTFSSAIKIEYDIQVIYEELMAYEVEVCKFQIRRQYFKFDRDIIKVIIYFLHLHDKNKKNYI